MLVFFAHVQCSAQAVTGLSLDWKANAMLHLQLNTNKQNSFVLQ